MNIFLHTKETIEKQKTFTGNTNINKSGIMDCTITDAKINSFGSKDKSLVFTLTTDDGAEAKYVSIQYINGEGEVNEKSLNIIRDMVRLSKVNFNGDNPEVFNDVKLTFAIKVVAKKSGKSAGFPQLFINSVFDKKGFTVKESYEKIKETKTKDFWEGVFEKDEPIVKSFKKENNSMSVEDRIAQSGVTPDESPFDESESDFPF